MRSKTCKCGKTMVAGGCGGPSVYWSCRVCDWGDAVEPIIHEQYKIVVDYMQGRELVWVDEIECRFAINGSAFNAVRSATDYEKYAVSVLCSHVTAFKGSAHLKVAAHADAYQQRSF